MALILKQKIMKINKNSRVQKETECTYNVFNANERKYIQFDTYGTSERKSESKSSQSIQFDKETAKYIIENLDTIKFSVSSTTARRNPNIIPFLPV